jgi:hypothetical protein
VADDEAGGIDLVALVFAFAVGGVSSSFVFLAIASAQCATNATPELVGGQKVARRPSGSTAVVTGLVKLIMTGSQYVQKDRPNR